MAPQMKIFVLAASMFCSALVACGDDDTDTTATTPASPTTAPLDAGTAAVVAAVERGDAAAIQTAVSFSSLACTTAPGAGGPPKCGAGEANGTTVRVFRFVGCEPEWRREPALDATIKEFLAVAKTPYAIFAPPSDYPLGGRAIAVFEGPDARAAGSKRGAAVGIDGAKVAGFQLGCGAGDGAKGVIPAGVSFIQPPK